MEAFRTGEGVNLIQDAVQLALQELIEAEAAGVISAGRYERTEARKTERNGTRARVFDDDRRRRAVADPEAAQGLVLPSILEPRRRVDQALYAVVMEAYVHGVSTRAVDELVAAMGSDTGSASFR